MRCLYVNFKLASRVINNSGENNTEFAAPALLGDFLC